YSDRCRILVPYTTLFPSYSDHTAIWEQALQRLQRNRIGFAIEQRHDDSRVCDVEIDVRGGETFSWNARPTVFDGIDTTAFLGCRSEEHTSELQSRENLVC